MEVAAVAVALVLDVVDTTVDADTMVAVVMVGAVATMVGSPMVDGGVLPPSGEAVAGQAVVACPWLWLNMVFKHCSLVK